MSAAFDILNSFKNTLFFVISALYLYSLCLPGIVDPVAMYGWQILQWGWISAPAIISWYANPLLWATLIVANTRFKKTAILLSIVTVLVGLQALPFQGTKLIRGFSLAGTPGYFAAGYYVWLIVLLLTVGYALMSVYCDKHKDDTSVWPMIASPKIKTHVWRAACLLFICIVGSVYLIPSCKQLTYFKGGQGGGERFATNGCVIVAVSRDEFTYFHQLEGVDIHTFTPILDKNGNGTEFAKDKNNVYANNTTNQKLASIDADSFEVLSDKDGNGSMFLKDKAHIYSSRAPLDPLMVDDVDMNSFVVVDSRHAEDNKHLFYVQSIYENAGVVEVSPK